MPDDLKASSNCIFNARVGHTKEIINLQKNLHTPYSAVYLLPIKLHGGETQTIILKKYLHCPYVRTSILRKSGIGQGKEEAITYSAETGEVSFVIDGKRFSPEAFGQMLELYEGWTLQYQIRDKSEERVRENEFLMPVELTRETLLGELRQAIFSFSDARDFDQVQFVSYKNTGYLLDALERVIDKLELLCSKGPLEEAVKVGEEMIEILRETETDDDFFPEYEISMIEQVIYRIWPRPDTGR